MIGVSATFLVSSVSSVRQFYASHFGAVPRFECGWYVVLGFPGVAGDGEVCFMERRGGAQEFMGGAMLNVRVASADVMHHRLGQAGVPITIPLDDHPWGDRGFGVVDPAGVVVYCYHPIEPSPEFKACFVISEPKND